MAAVGTAGRSERAPLQPRAQSWVNSMRFGSAICSQSAGLDRAADRRRPDQAADRGEGAGCTEPTVIKRRRQYAENVLVALLDMPQPSEPYRVLNGKAISKIAFP